MPATYSQDLRDRVFAAYDRGMKTSHIARLFLVSPSWARRLKQRRRETGETSARPRGTPGVRKFDRNRLAELVGECPDATLQELRDRLATECSTSAICEALKDLGLTRKKDDPRRGAGPSGRRSATRGMASVHAGVRRRTPDLHR